MTPRRRSRFDPRELRRGWDLQQQFHIPEREARFEVILDALRQTLPSRPRVIDLGCGTGSLSERVVRRFPDARVWAVDYDPVLLRVGREGFGNAGGRVTWVEADLRRSAWVDALPRGRFDGAVSTTALHWLTAAELRSLFRALAHKLRPGAVFLNGDSMPFDYGTGRPTHRRLRRIVRGIRSEHVPPKLPAGVMDWESWWKTVTALPELKAEVSERRRRYPHRHETVPAPSADWQIAELRRAGFREAGIIWQLMTDRVLLAVR